MGKTRTDGPEVVTSGNEWQMPQGGIEPGESLIGSSFRELSEETGVKTASLLEIAGTWWSYDFPEGYVPTGHKLDPFVGQIQKWLAFRFVGDDSEVDITSNDCSEPREFFDWRWMCPTEAIERAVVFKQVQYGRVFQAFGRHLA